MTTTDHELIIAEAAGEMALTTDEVAELERHEATIESGLETFLQVGAALADIKASRLYRATHGTWEDYVTQRWPQIGGRRQADRLIGAADVAADLATSGPIGPLVTSESQVRPLFGLKPEERRQAMQQATNAAGGAPPTAKQVAQAAQAMKPPAPRPATPAPAPAASPPATRPPALAIPAAAPAAVPPPLLTPLTPLAPVAPLTPDAPTIEARKLLAAKSALLDQALRLIDAELRRLPPGPTIVIRADAAIAAARLFVAGPALGGAATMLAFSATVEGGLATLPRRDDAGASGPPPTLAELEDDPLANMVRTGGALARIAERVRSIQVWIDEDASAVSEAARTNHQNELRACRRQLDHLADEETIDTSDYDALSARIGVAQARLAALESEVAA